jgi:hypothetical protein
MLKFTLVHIYTKLIWTFRCMHILADLGWGYKFLCLISCTHIKKVVVTTCIINMVTIPPSRLVFRIWVELFGPARVQPENKSPKHGPIRNNMGRTSTAWRRAWAGSQIPTRRTPGTARIDGPDLGRHDPIKPNLFNFFNLVRYRIYIVVILEFMWLNDARIA